MIHRLLKRAGLGSAIHFVYADVYKNTGSTVMRGEQLSEIAKQVLSSKQKVFYSPTKTKFKNCVLFLTKGALQTLRRRDLILLKLRANKLIFDPVDTTFATNKLK